MSHGFAGRIDEFRSLDEDALIGRLIDGVAVTGVDGHRNAQITAWRAAVMRRNRNQATAQFLSHFVVAASGEALPSGAEEPPRKTAINP
jgi:hypothetical protein